MAFEIILYSFAKKTNSTAQPTEGGASYQCEMRRPVSVLAPVVQIRSDTYLDYNYCYIPRYGRYYFVTDKVIGPANMYTFSLSVDPLASLKTQIGNLSEYIARSSAEFDGNVVDSMYPSTAGSYVAVNTNNSPFVPDLYTGTFVVGVMNNITGATSTALTYYAMDAAEYSKLITTLQSKDAMAPILGVTVGDDGIVSGLAGCLEGITYDIYLSLVNPIQYVVSSVYLPLTKSQLSTSASTTVKLGPYDLGFLATTIGYRATVECGSITIPKHPQAASRGNYLNMSPHSTYTMHFPGFGVFDLNSSRLGRFSSVSAKMVLDSYNGNAYLYLNTDDDDEDDGCLGILTGNIGINVPVTQLLANSDWKSQMLANVALVGNNLLNDKGGVLTQQTHNFNAYWNENGMAMAAAWSQGTGGYSYAEMQNAATAGGAATYQNTPAANPSAILDGVGTIMTLSMQGSPGGSAGLYGNWWLKNEYFQLVEEDNETLGRPLMEIRTINTIPGYIQCINPHFSSADTAQENDIVNGYLSNGFFFE